MDSSQTYGPSQVRDLSEQWGMSASCPNSSTHAGMHSATPGSEFQESSSSQRTFGTFHFKLVGRFGVPSALTFQANDSYSFEKEWEGAGFSPARGSNPPVVICEHDFSLAQLTAEVQRLNTAAA